MKYYLEKKDISEELKTKILNYLKFFYLGHEEKIQDSRKNTIL